MSKIGEIALSLTEQANELGYDSLDEAVVAGYSVQYKLVDGRYAAFLMEK